MNKEDLIHKLQDEIIEIQNHKSHEEVIEYEFYVDEAGTTTQFIKWSKTK